MEPTEADPGVPPALETGPDGEAASTGPEQALDEGVAEATGEGAEALPGGAVEFFGPAAEFLDKGGIAIWAITALSIMTLAIIIWKLWRYSRSGVWRRAGAEAAVDCWRAYRDDEALEIAMDVGCALGSRRSRSAAPMPDGPRTRRGRRPCASPRGCWQRRAPGCARSS